MSRTIRWILTLALLVGVFHETGPFTAVAVGLMFVSLEVLNVVVRRILDHELHR